MAALAVGPDDKAWRRMASTNTGDVRDCSYGWAGARSHAKFGSLGVSAGRKPSNDLGTRYAIQCRRIL